MQPVMRRSLDAPLESLQAGRAMASILLVLYHNTCCVFDVRKYWSRNPTGRAFHFGGWASFDYFFVLSGFILLHVHNKDLGDRSSFRGYLWRRFTRIYPIYWIILATLLGAYFAFPTLGQVLRETPE